MTEEDSHEIIGITTESAVKVSILALLIGVIIGAGFVYLCFGTFEQGWNSAIEKNGIHELTSLERFGMAKMNITYENGYSDGYSEGYVDGFGAGTRINLSENKWLC